MKTYGGHTYNSNKEILQNTSPLIISAICNLVKENRTEEALELLLSRCGHWVTLEEASNFIDYAERKIIGYIEGKIK